MIRKRTKRQQRKGRKEPKEKMKLSKKMLKKKTTLRTEIPKLTRYLLYYPAVPPRIVSKYRGNREAPLSTVLALYPALIYVVLDLRPQSRPEFSIAKTRPLNFTTSLLQLLSKSPQLSKSRSREGNLTFNFYISFLTQLLPNTSMEGAGTLPHNDDNYLGAACTAGRNQSPV